MCHLIVMLSKCARVFMDKVNMRCDILHLHQGGEDVAGLAFADAGWLQVTSGQSNFGFWGSRRWVEGPLRKAGGGPGGKNGPETSNWLNR